MELTTQRVVSNASAFMQMVLEESVGRLSLPWIASMRSAALDIKPTLSAFGLMSAIFLGGNTDSRSFEHILGCTCGPAEAGW